MQVTDVRVRKVLPEGKMKAVASVTLDDEFVVHDVRVVEGQNGLFIAMPSRKTPEGTFRDVAHPITAEAREMIQAAVLKAYEEGAAGLAARVG
ncbi:MAG: septation regulator SpoVG [Bacillota bacterium]